MTLRNCCITLPLSTDNMPYFNVAVQWSSCRLNHDALWHRARQTPVSVSHMAWAPHCPQSNNKKTHCSCPCCLFTVLCWFVLRTRKSVKVASSRPFSCWPIVDTPMVHCHRPYVHPSSLLPALPNKRLTSDRFSWNCLMVHVALSGKYKKKARPIEQLKSLHEALQPCPLYDRNTQCLQQCKSPSSSLSVLSLKAARVRRRRPQIRTKDFFHPPLQAQRDCSNSAKCRPIPKPSRKRTRLISLLLLRHPIPAWPLPFLLHQGRLFCGIVDLATYPFASTLNSEKWAGEKNGWKFFASLDRDDRRRYE